jgi:hypothetical protein
VCVCVCVCVCVYVSGLIGSKDLGASIQKGLISFVYLVYVHNCRSD